MLSKSNNQNLFPFKKRQYKNETGDLSYNIRPRKPTRKLIMIIIIKQNNEIFLQFCNDLNELLSFSLKQSKIKQRHILI